MFERLPYFAGIGAQGGFGDLCPESVCRLSSGHSLSSTISTLNPKPFKPYTSTIMNTDWQGAPWKQVCSRL